MPVGMFDLKFRPTFSNGSDIFVFVNLVPKLG